jgi:hypothetical protein
MVALGIGTLGLMLWEPHLEGRNVNATVYQIYFNDPFLVYAYTASILYFVGLYKAFKALAYVRQGKAYSEETAKALRAIKYCALAFAAAIAAPVAYLFIVRPEDDIAGGVAMGLFLILSSLVVATTAAMLQRKVQNHVI